MCEYLQQINIRDDNSQSYVGGIQLGYTDNNTIKGGNKQYEGMTKIQHLSIPLGLVLFPNLAKPNCKNIYKNMESDYLEDRIFDTLFTKTIMRTSKNTSHKKRPKSSKISKKKHLN